MKILIESKLIERPQIGATDSEGAMTLEFAFLAAGKTANHRFYGKDVLSHAVTAAQRRINEGRLYGSPKHPLGGLELDAVSHILTKMEMRNDTAWVRCKILPTGPGRNIQEIIKAGGRIGCSSRAVGSVRNESGCDVVQSDLRIDGVDFCLEPAAGTFVDAGNQVYESVSLEHTNLTEQMAFQLDQRYAGARLAGYKGSKEDFYHEVFRQAVKR